MAHVPALSVSEWAIITLQDAKAKAKAEKAEKAKMKEQERIAQAKAKAKAEGGGGDSKKAKVKKEAEAKKVVYDHQEPLKIACLWQSKSPLPASRCMLSWILVAVRLAPRVLCSPMVCC